MTHGATGERGPVYLAIDAVGEGLLGPGRAAVAAFTLGLLLTFLGVRINTRLIRAHVTWWFHDIESEGGLHVHHMVIGVVLIVVAGLTLIAALPHGLFLQLVALVFGVGVALTLDEFALILRLQDVYWTTEGRLSVDAVIVAVCAGTLLVLGARPLGNVSFSGKSGLAAGVAIAVTVLVDLIFAVLCLLKGKLWTGFFGFFIPVVGVVGAIRVARPQSPWAHRRYRDSSAKLAKAQRREDRVNATWRAWRTAFFDLIAGKPHLPSLTAAAETEVAGPRTREAPGAEPADVVPTEAEGVAGTHAHESVRNGRSDRDGPLTDEPSDPE
jgi:lysyl-tRNA synthetase class 2